MNIKEFKPGDIITRVEPMYFTDATGGSRADNMFIGVPVEYAGMVNGCIYVKIENPIIRLMEALGQNLSEEQKSKYKKTLCNVPFHSWQEGWERWVDPRTVFGDERLNEKGIFGMMFDVGEPMDMGDGDDFPDVPMEGVTKEYLEAKLKEAEEKEDFEGAAIILRELKHRFNYDKQ